MLELGEALGEVAHVVIVDERERGHRGLALAHFLLGNLGPNQIPEDLGTRRSTRLDDRELTTRIVDMTQRLGREVFLRQNSLEREDGEAALRALRVPLVVIVGENDQITPAEAHREMAAAIGCSHLVVIPKTGHMTPMEAPGAVNGALRHWLQRPAGHR